jgi:hypothetical protein
MLRQKARSQGQTLCRANVSSSFAEFVAASSVGCLSRKFQSCSAIKQMCGGIKVRRCLNAELKVRRYLNAELLVYTPGSSLSQCQGFANACILFCSDDVHESMLVDEKA